jgi:predicted RecB family nuclease
MVVRTQVTLDSGTHRRAKRRAADRGMSFAEYIRQVVSRDLGEEPKTDISAIFDLFESGRSDISANVDEYLGEALWKEHLSKTGQEYRLHEPKREDRQ